MSGGRFGDYPAGAGNSGQPGVSHSSSGWFDACIFTDWFPAVRSLLNTGDVAGTSTGTDNDNHRSTPIVLIGDNLASHFTERVLQLAAEHNIRFVCIPKNSTHVAQPLDVCFYRLLKIAWRKTLDGWKQGCKRKSQTLSKDVFPRLLRELMETLCGTASAHGTYISDNLTSGFEATGICPFNPERVLKKLPQEPTNTDNDPASLVSETVVELLKNMRYGSDEPTRRKKSKLNVAPGKSISPEDLQPSTSSAAGASTSSNCTRNRKGKAKKKLSVRVPVPVKHSRKMVEHTSDIEPDSDEEVHNSSDSDASSDHEADSSNNTSTMQAANEEKKLTTASRSGTGVGSLSGGNYVIVRFAKKKDGFKYYVAQVCSMPADQKSDV